MDKEESLTLVEQIESKHLLQQLIDQVKKDADLSGVEFDVPRDAQALHFLECTHQLLLDLLSNDFGSYLNFLYRIDVPEHSLKSIESSNPKEIADYVTLLVIKREWQKVFFRNKNL